MNEYLQICVGASGYSGNQKALILHRFALHDDVCQAEHIVC